ncbi:integrase family protein [Pontibacterium granulatum]|uniref:tyrosine-type recombinase/integrase n=1 Tax=Pontibacterium granulatum TaxID=2036029 RepID=UPI00249BD022|nr:integrase family protein [Pontibacterium granulatum]MDI3325836.1 integrase family protein [Pontibacterium granulatum]
MAQIEQVFSQDWVDKRIKEVDNRTGKHNTQDYKDIYTKAHGLRLRINSGGRMTYYIYERIKGEKNPKRITIGEARKIPLVSARGTAKRHQDLIANGKDPATHIATDPKGPTLREIFKDKTEGRGVKSDSNPNGLSKGTLKTYRADLNALGELIDKPINTITDKDVLDQHKIKSLASGPRMADRGMVMLRTLGNYAMLKYKDAERNFIVTRNPADIMKVEQAWNVNGGNTKRRNVAIDQTHIKQWWEAIEGFKDYKTDRNNKSAPLALSASYYFRFLLLTGVRAENAAMIEWRHVNLSRGTISFDDSDALKIIKNDERVTNMPLSDYVADMLRELHQHRQPKNKWVFPNASGGHVSAGMNDWMKRLRKATGMQYTANDMRRTFMTIAEACGLNSHTIKRLANHTRAHSDVTSGYIVANVEHLRSQTQLITNFILEEVGKEVHHENELALSTDLLEWSIAKSKETGDQVRDIVEDWARTGRLAEQFPSLSLNQIRMIQSGAHP